MKIMRTVMETAARLLPDREADPLLDARGYIGKGYSRVDGSLKVTGEARFTAEFDVEQLVHAALVCSTIIKGRTVRIDRAEATAAPGVLAVMTHENAPAIKAPSLMGSQSKSFAASDLPIMQDNRVHWNGQPVAVVVAETPEQAEHAASLVQIVYDIDAPRVSFDDLEDRAIRPTDIGEPTEIPSATPPGIGEAGPVDGYRTPPTNNAIEPHATIAGGTTTAA